jgi:hypothetical protein
MNAKCAFAVSAGASSDLIQCGNVGLLKAIDKVDDRRATPLPPQVLGQEALNLNLISGLVFDKLEPRFGMSKVSEWLCTLPHDSVRHRTRNF